LSFPKGFQARIEELKMNVIFMGNFFYPHGMANARRIQHFINTLTEKSVTVKVLLLRQSGQRVSNSALTGEYNGVSYKTIGSNINLDYKVLFTLAAYFRDGLKSLIEWKHNNTKNILYCYGGLCVENIVFVLIAKYLGYLIVFDIVEDGTFLQATLHFLARIKWVITELLDSYMHKLADAFVVVSTYLKALYEAHNHKLLPIVHIPISADCNTVCLKGDTEKPIKIVYSGTYAIKDGVELLIEAFENVCRINRNCLLLLSGKGSNLPNIQSRIAHNPAIHYIGYLNEIAFNDFLCQADILCITRIGSKFANAGFPFKLGEYLATGNPVVVSNVGDVSLYLDNMKDAIIIEPDNVKAIEEALLYCINNPGKAKVIGRNGREKCRIYFNPEVNGQVLFNLFNQI
jgi:glycosyltransferase involved in cell wall biosynthesis